jgi:hypothetical protein
MDKKKILKALTDIVTGNFELAEEDPNYDKSNDLLCDEIVEIEGAKVKLLTTLGGEGDGAEKSHIFTVKQGKSKMLARIDGYHSSWDSDYFEEDAYECVAFKKTVTDYKRVK